MNYEELLAARQDGRQHKTHLPIGLYYRHQVDGKYRGVVDISPELNSNIKFSESLKEECDANLRLVNSHLLHFTTVCEGDDIVRLELEQGHFVPLCHALNENPAIVAEPHFVENFVTQLLQVSSYLHKQGVYQVCFSPETVFLRKGDHAVMLLTHGSYYLSMSDPLQLYNGFENYVAPEVLNRGTIDERCDIYSIGKLLQQVFSQADIPIELRRVLKRAVSDSPEDRYNSAEDMLSAIQRKRNLLRSAITFGVAVVLALLCIAIYFDMFPESTPVEFVKPAPRQATDDLIEDGYKPEELGIVNADSLSDEDRLTQQEAEAKAEQIFRKRYEEEADRILSKIYNKDRMNVSEKNFLSQSESTIEELMKAQQEIAGEASISPEKSQLIASEIIERLTEQKKSALGGSNSRGIQK